MRKMKIKCKIKKGYSDELLYTEFEIENKTNIYDNVVLKLVKNYLEEKVDNRYVDGVSDFIYKYISEIRYSDEVDSFYNHSVDIIKESVENAATIISKIVNNEVEVEFLEE